MTNEITPFSAPPEVRVVEASAGSGKTFCLAKRYVQILLNPRLTSDRLILRHILAITFTNKAAYAMKVRILEFLKKAALGLMKDGEIREILSPLGLSSDEARPAAKQIMEDIIHRYNFFQVQTIDSFINALLSGCAFKLDLSAGFKIKRNYTDYLESGFDRLIDRASRDKEADEILAVFLHQYLFLENKPGWFPKKDMLDLLKALYSQSSTYGRDFVSLPVPKDDLFNRKKMVLALIRDLRDILPAGAHKKFSDGLDNFLSRYRNSFDFDKISNYFTWEEVPVKKGTEISPQLGRLWQNIRGQLRDLSEREAYSLFNPYVDIFNLVGKDFYGHASKDDVLFLPELNRQARKLFDEKGVTVEEIYYRLATRFRHYLLDEFQDTSRLQWKNLELMVEEALSTGGTFFYVGDKKQAIYGFRGGEVKLFDEVKERFNAFHVRVEKLETNYRSHRAIVEFNNRVFSTENLSRFILDLREEKPEYAPLSPMDMSEVENIFSASRQNVCPGREGGYVRVEFLSAADKAEQNEKTRIWLISLIADLKKRFSYSQIAILTRNNDEIEQLTGWLLSEGIFAESERTLNIRKHALIQEVLAVLRFLDSPVDDLSFARFIGGEIFTRVSGMSEEEVRDFLFENRLTVKRQNDVALYRVFRDHYPELWEKYFENFFKNVGLYPLYELSSSLLRNCEVFENFPDEHGFFLRFLELVKDKEEDFSDLNSFLENFENFEDDELFVNVVNSDAIKILTVHKAKGLEFPVVILPGLVMKIHSASGGGLGQQSYVVDTSEESLRLLRVKEKYLPFSEKLSELDRSQKARSFISELNNIYVALTRAVRELYVLLPAKAGQGRNLILPLFPREMLSVGEIQNIMPQTSEKRENRLGLPVSGQHDWISFLKDEFSGGDEILRRFKIRRGVVLHELLSRIGLLENRDIPRAVKNAVDEARHLFAQIEDWSVYETDLRKLLQNDQVIKFFNAPGAKVFQERDIVDENGQTRRVDRLIVANNEIMVVDYKSSRQGLDKYRDQVRNYMRILSGIEPGKNIKGFLVFLDDQSVEEVK